MSEPESNNTEGAIAIIGMSGRFPGAKNLKEFWRNLRDGVESVSFFSDEELRASGVPPELLANPNYVKARPVLEDADLFDASFFGFNPREAEILDPQHRLFLECAWEALEDAGYDSETYKGLIGLYAGMHTNSYIFNLFSNPEVLDSVGALQLVLGNDKDYLVTRTSYKLNLKGPCVTVQTACSTSLVAIHHSVQSLLDYQCDLALAGGVSATGLHTAGYLYQEGGINSPDGHCRAFDARAQGTLGGSGVGVVLLKRLAEAISDGDNIHAVIKGSAINNDGAFKAGFTAPSVEGQAEVIAMAQAVAGVSPDTISCIEAHGTATPLGDPIEVAALTQAFRAGTSRKRYCALGSVKTNIGHLDAAAGVAGLIKTVLALKNRMLPPSLHFERPNPQIDLENGPFYVNTSLKEWKANGTPRRAGVSSFGMGGTNAHVILEEAPPTEPSGEARRCNLLLLSARTGSALDRATADLASHLRENPGLNLSDVAFTLQVGRRVFAHRRAVICRDQADAVEALEGQDAKRAFTGKGGSSEPSVVFMFPGQGTQRAHMAQELYREEPAFREEFDRCSKILVPHLGLDLRDAVYPPESESELAARELEQTRLTQPALFVTEYALARLWMRWGARPRAMIGHSIGEYVAACLAGTFSLEDALRLVAARGRLMQGMPRGAMLALPLSEQEVEPLLGEALSIASINAPSACVVSGPQEAIDDLQTRLDGMGLAGRLLKTSHAFHSKMMEPTVEPFLEHLKRIRLNPPATPFLSNVTGTWITPEQATSPKYWAEHMVQTVRFDQGLRGLLTRPEAVLIEVGPGQTLTALAKQQPARRQEQVILSSLPRANEGQSELEQLLSAVGQAWIAGVKIDWTEFHHRARRRRVSLPTYPFQRQRYWVANRQNGQNGHSHSHALGKRADIADWFYNPTWERSMPVAVGEAENAGEPSSWLLFAGPSSIGFQMAERLKDRGKQVAVVTPGEQFEVIDDSTFRLNPARRDHYDLLLNAVCARRGMPGRIIHLWTVTRPEEEGPALDSNYSNDSNGLLRDRGIYSLLFLAQALGERMLESASGPASEMIKIAVVSNGLHEVTGEEALCPDKATVLGPCRVIPHENPSVKCASIDIQIPEPGTWREEMLVAQLISELEAQASETVVAYRGNHRWVPRYREVKIDRPGSMPARLRDRGVYLITGGLGGIGLEIAAYLAKTAGARLALTARSSFPPREDWDRWVETNGTEDETSRRIAKLKEIESLGSEVMIFSADVADPDRMREVAGAVASRFGGVNGVIHAAGVPGGGMIQLQTKEKIEGALASKVAGTKNILRVFKDAGLDFLLLFSSQRSILGGFGRVDYCAANAYLDAVAHYISASGGPPTISINWDTWKEAGMSLDAARRFNLNPEEALKEGMRSEEGVDVFSRILFAGIPQVIVSTRDFNAVIKDGERPAEAATVEDPVAKPAAREQAHSRPELSTPYVEPRNDVERAIAEIWQALLGIDRIGVHDNFFELGGDSVITIQIIARVNQAGLRLSPKQVFERQTIAGLAEVAGTARAVEAQQGVVSGPVPLTPIQSWFFAHGLPDPHHYNQALMLEVREEMDAALLEKAVGHLVAHHDSLRLRYSRKGAIWEQRNAGLEGIEEVDHFSYVDLSGLPDISRRAEVEASAARAQTSLNLSDGPTARFVLFGLGETSRLLIVAHHLAVDAVSWRILLEDLGSAYGQLKEGKPVALPSKTTSFKRWAELLEEYAQSPELREEASFWARQSEGMGSRLPVDYEDGVNTVASARALTVSLGPDESRALLQDVPRAYHTQINDVLLTCLAEAFAGWMGRRALLVDLEGHGRDAIFEQVDLSRTAGWFTTMYPVALDLRGSSDPVAALKSVKQHLRSIPGNGLGYGVLKYLSRAADSRGPVAPLPEAEVSFLYLGQFDQVMGEASPFAPAGESCGPIQNEMGNRPHLLAVTGFVSEGRFQSVWTYSENVHKRSTVEALSQSFISALKSMAESSRAPVEKIYTPSDFPEAELSQNELDELLAQLSEAEE
ncbi:MAG TPA: SDR family NAD(P)-dependent oxidoreductase [Blastocatellia bacterium]|nr:SDR family NAD(P)-dependent oxidoreductase [Blastocatellia bacterium]